MELIYTEFILNSIFFFFFIKKLIFIKQQRLYQVCSQAELVQGLDEFALCFASDSTFYLTACILRWSSWQKKIIETQNILS